MNLSDSFTVPAHVMARQVGDETVILDLATGTYFGVDNAGARIWELVASGKDLTAICQAVLDEFDAEPAQVEADVLRLVQELLAKSLLQAAA